MAEKDNGPVTSGVSRLVILGREGLLLAFVILLAILALAGARLTGFDNTVGRFNEEVAVIGFDYSVPAVGNMARGAVNVAKDRIGKQIAPLGQKGKDALKDKLGEYINLDKFGVETSGTTVNGTPVAEAPPAGGTVPITPPAGGGTVPELPTATAAPSCSYGVSDATRLAVQAWQAGDWNRAQAQLNLAPGSECAAREFAKNYIAPFKSALDAMTNADNQVQVEVYAEQVIALNPRYPGGYAAKAFTNAYQTLSSAPLDSGKAASQLSGARITVVGKVNNKRSFLPQADDKYQLQIDFGEGWAGAWEFTRTELQALATALGFDEKALVEAGKSYTAPGSYMEDPSTLPPVPAPDLEQYVAAPTPLPTATLPPQPTPAATEAPAVAATEAPAVQPATLSCTFNSPEGMRLGEWVRHVLKMDWAKFLELNPGANEQTKDSGTFSVIPITGACP